MLLNKPTPLRAPSPPSSPPSSRSSDPHRPRPPRLDLFNASPPPTLFNQHPGHPSMHPAQQTSSTHLPPARPPHRVLRASSTHPPRATSSTPPLAVLNVFPPPQRTARPSSACSGSRTSSTHSPSTRREPLQRRRRGVERALAKGR